MVHPTLFSEFTKCHQMHSNEGDPHPPVLLTALCLSALFAGVISTNRKGRKLYWNVARKIYIVFIAFDNKKINLIFALSGQQNNLITPYTVVSQNAGNYYSHIFCTQSNMSRMFLFFLSSVLVSTISWGKYLAFQLSNCSALSGRSPADACSTKQGLWLEG